MQIFIELTLIASKFKHLICLWLPLWPYYQTPPSCCASQFITKQCTLHRAWRINFMRLFIILFLFLLWGWNLKLRFYSNRFHIHPASPDVMLLHEWKQKYLAWETFFIRLSRPMWSISDIIIHHLCFTLFMFTYEQRRKEFVSLFFCCGNSISLHLGEKESRERPMNILLWKFFVASKDTDKIVTNLTVKHQKVWRKAFLTARPTVFHTGRVISFSLEFFLRTLVQPALVSC